MTVADLAVKRTVTGVHLRVQRTVRDDPTVQSSMTGTDLTV